MNLPVGQAGETGRNGTPAANRPFRLESTARAAAHEAGLGAGPARRGEATGPLPREVEVLPEPLPALDEPGPGYGWLGAVVIVGLLAFWELVARLGWVAPLYLPAPTAIAQELVRMAASGTLGASLTASLSRILWGLLLGAAAGLAVGMAVGLSRVAEGALDPLISLLYPIPKIAVLPLFVLWLGIGEASKVAIIATGVFFPVAINTIAGVRQTSPLLIRAALSLGANRRQVVTKVVLPSALPVIFSGLRLGTGMALLLVVSAEMVAATTGLGFLILNAGDLMLTTRLMAGIVVLSALGILSTWLLRQLERWLLPWHEP